MYFILFCSDPTNETPNDQTNEIESYASYKSENGAILHSFHAILHGTSQNVIQALQTPDTILAIVENYC